MVLNRLVKGAWKYSDTGVRGPTGPGGHLPIDAARKVESWSALDKIFFLMGYIPAAAFRVLQLYAAPLLVAGLTAYGAFIVVSRVF